MNIGIHDVWVWLLWLLAVVLGLWHALIPWSRPATMERVFLTYGASVQRIEQGATMNLYLVKTSPDLNKMHTP